MFEEGIVVLETAAQQASQSRKLLVILIDGPDHDTAETDVIGPVSLLLEGLVVVEADPLICSEGEVFDGGVLIVDDFGVFVCDYILDLETNPPM